MIQHSKYQITQLKGNARSLFNANWLGMHGTLCIRWHFAGDVITQRDLSDTKA